MNVIVELIHNIQAIALFESDFYADRMRVYASALDPSNRIFAVQFVHTNQLCENLCALSRDCVGIVYTPYDDYMCIGLRTLGSDVVDVADLLTARGRGMSTIDRQHMHPIALRRLFDPPGLEADW